MAINSASLPNSKISPFFLNYGFHPCFESDVFNMHSQQNDRFESTEAFVERLHGDWLVTYTVMLKLQQVMRDAVDPHRRLTDIQVGDDVLVNVKAFDRPTLYPRGQLMPYFAGPYRVLRQVSPNTY